MTYFVAALLVIAGFVFSLIVLHWVVTAIQRGAAVEERLREVKREADVEARQADEMLKEKSVEDTARDLDSGTF